MDVDVVAPKEIPSAIYPFGPHHNPNVSCAFHEGCFVFKNRVQDLIDQNILSFTEEKSKVKENPLPNHGS